MLDVLNVVNRHGAAMATRDPKTILSDYAENCIVLTNLADKPLVSHQDMANTIALNYRMEDELNAKTPNEIIFQRSCGEYAMHVFANPETTLFGVESYLIRDGLILYESAFLHFWEKVDDYYRPAPTCYPKTVLEKPPVSGPARDTLDIINLHGRRMSSEDPDIILRDYAPDCVVMTNLAEPAVGHNEIRKLIAHSLQTEEAANPVVPNEIIFQRAQGEFGLHVFKNDHLQVLGVESYVVRNGKIAFESAYIHHMNG